MCQFAYKGPYLYGEVSSRSCLGCKRGKKINAVHVAHTSGQGHGRLSTLTRRRIQIPGGVAYLRSTRCATAFVS
jgi:hypothetical protein